MAADSCNVVSPRASLVSAKPRANFSAVHQPYDRKISNRSRDRLDVVRLSQPGALLPSNRPEMRAIFPALRDSRSDTILLARLWAQLI